MHPEPEPTRTAAPSFASTHTAADAERTGEYHPQRAHTLPTVPGYRLEKELGRGGMGIVYLAFHEELKRPVALKMLLHGTLAGSPTLARFLAESEALAALPHPHIVQVFARGEQHGLPYFVMEYCPQGSLADRVKETPLPSAEAAHVVEQLADAVAVAHAHNILHRDLKPGNVLYAADGTPKLSDFGLVKRLDQNDGEPLTHTGAILGTPSYMAPEQAEGKEAGVAADIYGLGAIFYRLLTGRAPYVASSTAVTLQLVLAGDLVAPRQLNPTVPRDLETICLKCLHREPNQRYANAADLAADLGRWRRQEPIHARPSGIAERVHKWCRRHPARAAFAGALVLLVGTIITGTSYIAVREHQQAQQEAQFNTDLRREKAEKEQALRNERMGSARLALDRGQLLCEQGDIARGLLAMVAGLTPAIDAEAPEIEGAIRHNISAWERECWSLEWVEQGPPGVHVATVTMAPPGTTVAIAYSDHRVLIKALTGNVASITLPHEAAVEQLQFSTDGDRLLTRTRTTLRVWNARTGERLGLPFEEMGGFVTATMRPDGKAVAWVPRIPARPMRLHDLVTARTIHEWPQPKAWPFTLLVFHPDGHELAVGDASQLHRWDTTTGQPSGPPLSHDGTVCTASYSPNGRYLVTGTRFSTRRVHATVSLWKADGTLVAESLLEGTQPDVQFSLDSTRYASRTLEGAVQLRATTSGELLPSPNQRWGATTAVAFTPDSAQLVLGGRNGELRFWNLALGTTQGPVLHHQGDVRHLSISADPQHLITVDGALRHWQRPLGTRHGALEHSGDVFCCAFSPDSKHLLTGTSKGVVSVWDIATRQLRYTRLQPGLLLNVAYTPDGNYALTAGSGPVSNLWDTRTWQATAVLPGHERGTLVAAISADGARAVTAGQDGSARVWTIPAGQPVGAALVHKSAVRAVAFRPDGTVLLCGCFDGTAQLWDVATGQPLGKPLSHKSIEAVAFTPDGRYALTAGHDAEVRLWDATTGERVGHVPSPSTFCQTLAISPNSQYVLACGFNAIVSLQMLTNGQAVGRPLQHRDVIRTAQFAPDGQTALTGSYDGTSRRWHVPTGFPVGPVQHDNHWLRVVAYSPDGRWGATGGWGGKASLWAIAPRRSGTPEQIQRALEQRHGLLMTSDGSVRTMTAAEWQTRNGLP